MSLKLNFSIITGAMIVHNTQKTLENTFSLFFPVVQYF